MNISESPAAVTAFFEKHIIPQIPSSWGQWCAAFALGGCSSMILNEIEKNKPMMKSLGLIDDNGTVDIDKLETFGNGAFDKVPEIKIGVIGITKTEFTEFIKFIKANGA